MTRLGNALDELEAEGVNIKAVNIARLWALTDCRRDESAAAALSDICLCAQRADAPSLAISERRCAVKRSARFLPPFELRACAAGSLAASSPPAT